MLTAVVTGASRGIGRATARRLAAKGYAVVINYLNSAESARELEQEILNSGSVAMAVRADVSDRKQVDDMIAAASKELGTIQLLVNNAGIARQELFTDVSCESWQRMLDVNLTGAFNCTQAVLPGMIDRKSGNIINISSMWGIVGSACEVAYSAAKAGLIGFTKALAKEVGPSGIRVNCVAPGMIMTDMNSSFDCETILSIEKETPLGRVGTPEEIAETVCFLASATSAFITGQVISPNGGLVI